MEIDKLIAERKLRLNEFAAPYLAEDFLRTIRNGWFLIDSLRCESCQKAIEDNNETDKDLKDYFSGKEMSKTCYMTNPFTESKVPLYPERKEIII